MVLKKGTAFFEDFFKKIQEGIHDISNREAHQKGCGQRIQIVSCLGNAAADIWQIADDLFKQNQCGKQNKRIDTDFASSLSCSFLLRLKLSNRLILTPRINK